MPRACARRSRHWASGAAQHEVKPDGLGAVEASAQATLARHGRSIFLSTMPGNGRNALAWSLNPGMERVVDINLDRAVLHLPQPDSHMIGRPTCAL